MTEMQEERVLLERMEGLFHRAALDFERARIEEKIGPEKRTAFS
ncbi:MULTISPECIES: hypothetical protein [Asaia]|uniref:Uncharacterized protein n=1 Tax=Asaia bogorensis TaxID=91915 RepID=A0A060QEU0_9PROT|nr:MULTISPECIES: hypothetical protein [Asaia]ETD00059.1 hypothetical protein P792_00340 [Asaia sp. SF2.1]CDG39639.1 hypothetical protein ASAP_1594 [Asaia bogorensis]